VSGPLATYVVEVKNEDGETIATFQGTAYRKREHIDLSAWG
jgi:acyl-coenzyme A thioesterase PaaI-like protein